MRAHTVPDLYLCASCELMINVYSDMYAYIHVLITFACVLPLLQGALAPLLGCILHGCTFHFSEWYDLGAEHLQIQ